MENAILDSLEDLGYQGSVKEFNKMIKEGPKNCDFTKIVEWLSKELQVLCKLESQVNAISSADDSSSFLLELSSFLKEMNCPYQCLLQGNVSQRLGSKENRLILLTFLTTELQAARIVNVDKPEKNMQVEMQETPTAKDMKSMITTLKLGKPPANITPAQLFGKLESRINEIISKMPPNKLSSPLFTGKLSDKQWFILNSIQETMKKEYQLRREMLLKRLDVTIQSFKWSDRLKFKEKEIMDAYVPLRQLLGREPAISLSDVLAAREDLTIIEKTSNMHVREKTQLASVNKVVIGRVPDRGGRPEEQQPPPPEMPSWQKRTDTPKDTNVGRGGGRIQGGGWSGGNTQQQTNSYGQGGNRNDHSGGYTGGGYQSGGGGYQAGGGRGGGYGGGYVQQGGGYQTGYQPGYVQVDQGGYQTGYMQGGQAMYQVPYQPVQGGYAQAGYQMGQGGYGQGGGDSRNVRYNDQQGGDNRNRGQQYNPSAPRGGYSSRNEGCHYTNDGGGGSYNQDHKDGWQSRGGGRGGRGGGRGGRGGRGGGRYDSQNQGYGANYGYPGYDQGYGQHNQRY